MKSIKFLTISCLTSLNLIACSVSSNGPSVPGLAKKPIEKREFSDPRKTITGPKVDGNWISECTHLGYEESWRKFNIQYSGNTVTHKTEYYSDDECQTSVKVDSFKGRFRFIDSYEGDIYVIEYAFDLENGITSFTMENLKVDGEALYIGNFASGEGMGVLENEPLYLVDENGEGDTSPPNQQAEVATTYKEAKYAVCNLQGRVMIVDLKGTDISKTGTGTTRIAAGTCDGDVDWYDGQYDIQVTYTGEFPLVTFTTLQGSRIETGASGTGLLRNDFPSSAFSVIGGNSGVCYFSKTKAVKDLYKICD